MADSALGPEEDLSGASAHARVLVAEDDAPSRHLVELILAELGYEVISVANGTDAWKTLQGRDAPNLAILDVMMPGIDGLEITRRLRAEPLKSYVYIILVTARGFKDDVMEGFAAGADDYMVKPFEFEELRARLQVGTRILSLETRLAEIQHEQAVMQMAATLGHEINNPLATIIPSVELLRMEIVKTGGLPDRDRTLKRLTAIENSAFRIQEIVEKFIHLSKVRIKGYTPDSSMLDLE